MIIKVSFIFCSILLAVKAYSQNWESTDLDTLFDENGKILSVENHSNDYKEILTLAFNTVGSDESRKLAAVAIPGLLWSN